ncbi:MAG: hypothetical protein Q4E75_04925, partial [bacterium]|nr:hypothetical protein [bacterium]
MYDERRDKFSFKNFFLTLLLVLLFIFLMLWLFPTKSYVNNKLSNNSNGNSSSKSNEKYDLERLEVLYDEIFANNVYRMKEAAISYFTNERMPQIVGQSKKLTLQEMYDLHLVLKMKDKDGKACDVKKSFVEMTKYTEEYRLKVNLSCGDTEDYIIVYLGCYNYCSSGLCEKKTSTPSKKTAYEENRLTPIVVEPKKNDPENPTPAKHKCKVVDGKYYDAKGNIVSKEEYKKSCEVPTPTKHECEVVDGKYYDAKGNIVSKE